MSKGIHSRSMYAHTWTPKYEFLDVLDLAGKLMLPSHLAKQQVKYTSFILAFERVWGQNHWKETLLIICANFKPCKHSEHYTMTKTINEHLAGL